MKTNDRVRDDIPTHSSDLFSWSGDHGLAFVETFKEHIVGHIMEDVNRYGFFVKFRSPNRRVLFTLKKVFAGSSECLWTDLEGKYSITTRSYFK